MDQELKMKWISALRSGTIQQAKGRLKAAPDRMCCLGVLRHVDNPNNRKTNGNGLLSDDDIQRLGLTLGVVKRLAVMNDGSFDGDRRHSFDEIAEHIEANL